MDLFSFQACGDTTEIFRSADDEATPVVIVPFLDAESFEEHRARVEVLMVALNGN